MSTTVINIKDAPEGWENNLEYVYVGRSNKNHPNIGWGNPFPMRVEADRAYVVKMYIAFIQRRLQDGDLNIMLLADKKLVCYCAPKLCHGDILALIVNTIQYSSRTVTNRKDWSDERFASSEL